MGGFFVSICSISLDDMEVRIVRPYLLRMNRDYMDRSRSKQFIVLRKRVFVFLLIVFGIPILVAAAQFFGERYAEFPQVYISNYMFYVWAALGILSAFYLSRAFDAYKKS